MSKSNSNNAATSTPTTTVPDSWDDIPCVQYGFPDDKGAKRTPKLQTIFESIPEHAETTSPVYILSRDQYERQNDFESGYEVKDYTSIATELQDECENNDRVLYPVHIESDAYHDEAPATLIKWFRKFVENDLEVAFHTCTLYFSGHRSIHVHVPRFVSGEDQRERLKGLAETFCTDNGAELDCGLYSRKRMFRLPGVAHAKTGLRKVEIESEWNHDRIFQQANEAAPNVPNSYETVLRNVFATQPSLTVESSQTTFEPPHDLFQVLDSEKTALEFESDGKHIETPLIEQEQYPDEVAAVQRWTQYNAKEFSPYALASGNNRSVAVVEVESGAFARKDVRNGTALVPAYFYGAQGCAGEEFMKEDEHAPLQLSVPDFEKWDYEPGDDVVIIGGQSRDSRIFGVEPWEAPAAGDSLTGEDASREGALNYLESQGYDVGKGGDKKESTPSNTTRSQGQNGKLTPVEKPSTEAATLQQQAEQNGIETLTHMERWRVACRVLKWGWEPAWEWFKQQFGVEFDPKITRKQLQSVIEAFPDDYDHVEEVT